MEKSDLHYVRRELLKCQRLIQPHYYHANRRFWRMERKLATSLTWFTFAYRNKEPRDA